MPFELNERNVDSIDCQSIAFIVFHMFFYLLNQLFWRH